MTRIKPSIPEASPVLCSIGISPSLLYVWYKPCCVYPTLTLHQPIYTDFSLLPLSCKELPAYGWSPYSSLVKSCDYFLLWSA